MAVTVTFLPVLFLFPVYLWPFVTQANQFTVDCSFGKPDLASNLTMSAMVTGRLAASKYQSHLCVVKTSGPSHQKRFLQVKAKIVNSESNGKRVCLLSFDILGKLSSFQATYAFFRDENRPTASRILTLVSLNNREL